MPKSSFLFYFSFFFLQDNGDVLLFYWSDNHRPADKSNSRSDLSNKVMFERECLSFKVTKLVVERVLNIIDINSELQKVCDLVQQRHEQLTKTLGGDEGRVAYRNFLRADLHGTTLSHTTSLRQAYDMT